MVWVGTHFVFSSGERPLVKISVITVTYNAADTLRDTLLSVAQQQGIEVEHIVVDGGSTDATKDVIGKHGSHVARFISESDRGIYDAMNKGIGASTGEVVGFLNADDFYTHPHVLQKVRNVMSDAGTDACYADLVYVDRQDTSRLVRYWKSRPYKAGLCRKGWLPAHPTFFVRRKVYEKWGGFDLEFPRQADFEMALRLFDVHQIRSVYVPEVWVRMRTGGLSNNSVAGVIRGNIEAYRACRKNGVQVTPFFVVRKVLSRVPQFLTRPPMHFGSSDNATNRQM
jgi:glycosyltransferase involved in cell wall biosynthesis